MYSSVLSPFYDELTRDVPYEKFIEFYESIFSDYGVSPAEIVDLGCGTGTLTVLMAEKGYDMIGVDISPEMLALAVSKTYELENKPLFLCQPLAKLDLYGTVQAAVSSLDSFSYMEHSEISEIFRRVNLFLEPGGVFIFDVNLEEKYKNISGQVFRDETENVLCVWSAEYFELQKKCVYDMDVFSREGNLWLREKEKHVEYAHDKEDIIEKLASAGFRNIKAIENNITAGETGLRLFFTTQK